MIEHQAQYTTNAADTEPTTTCSARRVFLLSPANAAGVRAQMILRDGANSDLAQRLHNGGAPLGELFTFMSGLYFRGKLAYARAFADVPSGRPGALIITACGGLVSPDTIVTRDQLHEISAINVDPADMRYRGPLTRDLRILAAAAGVNCEIILLGSIATPKYVEPLLDVLGKQLLFPTEFVGRGDMSRGGLMLRCVQSGIQLNYVPIQDAARHGCRPPKLMRLTRKPSRPVNL
jgi:hypothetical protein